MPQEFRETIRVYPDEYRAKMERELDAYMQFISEALPGYIHFAEVINSVITKLEKEGVIKKAKLRCRLKSINSSIINTNKKSLDDMFGFEIITENETEKEIVMIIIHNLFVKEYVKEKNYNKSNGYFAHHCTGAAKLKLDGTEGENLEEHIMNSLTDELKEQYRDLSRQEQGKFKRTEIYTKKPRYPTLRQKIIQNGDVDEKLKANIINALRYADELLDYELRKNMPIVEVQFKTTAVEQEIKCGRAQHVKYKKVNEDEVKKKYFQKRLVRGVDFPFIIFRNYNGELEIEHTNKTLTSMWPFLEDCMKEFLEKHANPVANYDMYFATVLPGLKPYVEKNLCNEPSIPVNDSEKGNIWNLLRNKILNNSFVLPDYREVYKVK